MLLQSGLQGEIKEKKKYSTNDANKEKVMRLGEGEAWTLDSSEFDEDFLMI